MKRFLIGTLSTLLLSSLTLPVLAENIAISSSEARNITEISPFNLVTGAYQGRFENQGIPSSGMFLSKIRSNKIEAEDLVKSAISAGRLSANTINDLSYIHSVETLMNTLDLR